MIKNEIKQELYNLYKYAIEDASSMWISEYSCSAKEDNERRREDEEDLKYFKKLLSKL